MHFQRQQLSEAQKAFKQLSFAAQANHFDVLADN
jgi:hypothetical protein